MHHFFWTALRSQLTKTNNIYLTCKLPLIDVNNIRGHKKAFKELQNSHAMHSRSVFNFASLKLLYSRINDGQGLLSTSTLLNGYGLLHHDSPEEIGEQISGK